MNKSSLHPIHLVSIKRKPSMQSTRSLVWYYNGCPCTSVPIFKLQWFVFGMLIRVQSDDNKLCVFYSRGMIACTHCWSDKTAGRGISSSDFKVITSHWANFKPSVKILKIGISVWKCLCLLSGYLLRCGLIMEFIWSFFVGVKIH